MRKGRSLTRWLRRLIRLAILAAVGLFLYDRYQVNPEATVRALLTFLQMALNLSLAVAFAIIQFVAIFYYLGRTHSYWVRPGETGVGFEDYRGNPEVLEQAKRLVTLLKGARGFKQMGGEISRGVLLVGPPGTGKCLTGDTIVITTSGAHYLGDYASPTQAPDSFRPLEVEIITHRGSVKTSHFYYGGAQQVMRLTTRRGYSVTATPEHPVLAITENGELAFQQVQHLKPGDYVAIWRGNGEFGGDDDLLARTGSPEQYLPLRVPERADEDLGYFLGLTVGDGCTRVSGGAILFYKPSTEVTEAWASFVTGRLGVTVHRSPGCSGGDALYACNQTMKRWLGALGIELSLYSKERVVPRVVLEGPSHVVRGFLQGLFDTDGSLRVDDKTGAPMVSYSTGSAELARQIHILLLKFGIVGRLATYHAVSKGKPNTMYRVLMSGNDARLFMARIGSRRRDVAEKMASAHVGQHHTTTLDVVPNVSTHLRALYTKGMLTSQEIRRVWQYVEGRVTPTRGKLAEILQLFASRNPAVVSHPSYQHLLRLVECPYYFDRVHSVQPVGEELVYDFTVPVDHSFVTNGLISHNSYLAQVIANEAGVPFAYMSAASLTSMFWGVGNLKVAGLYRKARKMAQEFGACIVFMDEFDAIGTSRTRQGGSGFPLFGGANTLLNELLLQMDPPRVETRWWARLLRSMGLRPKPGARPLIITCAATNIAEALDPALLRPGRFDRKIVVEAPDHEGRKDVLSYYIGKVAHDSSLDTQEMLNRMAADMQGATPAVIQHVINEAVIKAHFDGRDRITYEDISYALDTHQWGLKRPIRGQSEEERRAIAYHEAGHAVAQLLLLPNEKVYKVTIIRHDRALGLSASRPMGERHIRDEHEVRAQIAVCLASQASEELFLGKRYNGTESDIHQATWWATHYVGAWGLGQELSDMDQLELSDDQKKEVRELLRQEKARVKELLARRAALVHALAARLLEKNEVLGPEVEDLAAQYPEEAASDGA